MRTRSHPTHLPIALASAPRTLLRGAWLPSMAALLLISGCAPKGGDPGNTASATTSTTTAEVTTGTGSSGGEIVIGEYGGLSGNTAGFGQTTHEGIMLAVDEINAAGGVKGKKLKLFTEDDESQKEKVRNVVTKLITQDDAERHHRGGVFRENKSRAARARSPRGGNARHRNSPFGLPEMGPSTRGSVRGGPWLRSHVGRRRRGSLATAGPRAGLDETSDRGCAGDRSPGRVACPGQQAGHHTGGPAALRQTNRDSRCAGDDVLGFGRVVSDAVRGRHAGHRTSESLGTGPPLHQHRLWRAGGCGTRWLRGRSMIWARRARERPAYGSCRATPTLT